SLLPLGRAVHEMLECLRQSGTGRYEGACVELRAFHAQGQLRPRAPGVVRRPVDRRAGEIADQVAGRDALMRYEELRANTEGAVALGIGGQRVAGDPS